MVNILVVDSHPVVRNGLKQFLNEQPNYEVVGSLNSGVEIFEFVRRHNVDLIISEIDLPELNGITALRAIKKENKDINEDNSNESKQQLLVNDAITAAEREIIEEEGDLDAATRAIYGGDEESDVDEDVDSLASDDDDEEE